MGKNRNRISFGVAKEYWNSIDSGKRYKILLDYLSDYLYDSDYRSTNDDLINLSNTDWKGLPLYNCDIPISERRHAVCYYLGIGDFDNYKSNDVKWQREYKLRVIKIR